MFLGTHSPRLDEKGRMFLPAKYREELAAGVVITKGQERCLYVFPVAEFARITEGLSTAPVTAKAVRDYSRVFFASASDEVPDKQGRGTVPQGVPPAVLAQAPMAAIAVHGEVSPRGRAACRLTSLPRRQAAEGRRPARM